MDEDTFWRLLARFQGIAAVGVGVAIGATAMYFTRWQILSLALGCLAAAALDGYFRLHSFDPNRLRPLQAEIVLYVPRAERDGESPRDE